MVGNRKRMKGARSSLAEVQPGLPRPSWENKVSLWLEKKKKSWFFKVFFSPLTPSNKISETGVCFQKQFACKIWSPTKESTSWESSKLFLSWFFLQGKKKMTVTWIKPLISPTFYPTIPHPPNLLRFFSYCYILFFFLNWEREIISG